MSNFLNAIYRQKSQKPKLRSNMMLQNVSGVSGIMYQLGLLKTSDLINYLGITFALTNCITQQVIFSN
jgi:hypothetical protein